MEGGPNLWFGVSRGRVGDGHALRCERAPESSCEFLGFGAKKRQALDVREQIARKGDYRPVPSSPSTPCVMSNTPTAG